MRCFLGCDLTAQAKLALDEWRDKALRVEGQFQTIKPANFHVTTWFLGSITSAQLDSLIRQLEDQLEQSELTSFDLHFNDIVAWSKPKIVAAIPLDLPPELTRLHQFCKRIADSVKIPAKGNHDIYRPHVTLTRKVRPEQVSPPLFAPDVSTRVTHLHLFESVSGHRGVQYVPRFSFALPGVLSIRERLKKGVN